MLFLLKLAQVQIRKTIDNLCLVNGMICKNTSNYHRLEKVFCNIEEVEI